MTEHQPDLFDGGAGFEPCDPTVPAEARPRLSRQCRLILDRLARGPALNTELVGIAMKYTSRISDIRKAGFGIRCTVIDSLAGLYRYELEPSA